MQRYSGAENNTRNCLRQLKEKGFRIVATTPHKNDCSIHELPVDKKIALVFGTEQEGISNDVLEEADEFVKIPMHGFTESFNISVSAALCMFELTRKIRSNSAIEWGLSKEEKDSVYLTWLRNSIKNVELIEKEFFFKK